ncbi:exopolysaccharide production repressor protein (plasmid) [Rhizobium sp. N113]|nr:exopolysaccharide production repressor protein [Rhizobium etli bv. phaseoli str. IE4803]ANL24652.1 exopolysaccharide production repressor protein [Rhizobium sp. N113]
MALTAKSCTFIAWTNRAKRQRRRSSSIGRTNGSKTLPFRTFFCILLLVTCTSAVSAYAASLSIFKAFAVTLAASVFLQVVYFLSLLFMSFRPTRESDRSIHSGTRQANQPQKHDRDETELTCH